MHACAVCGHPKIIDIDKRLCIGETSASIAAEFALAPGTMRLHREKHLPEKLRDIYKHRKLKPLEEYLDMMRARGETVMRQAIPCQELDGTEDPDSEPVPLIDFEKHTLTEIANLFKSQVALNELIGRATGELNESGDSRQSPQVRLSIMLPDKAELGGKPREYLEYRRRESIDSNGDIRIIEGEKLPENRLISDGCTTFVEDELEPLEVFENKQLTLELE